MYLASPLLMLLCARLCLAAEFGFVGCYRDYEYTGGARDLGGLDGMSSIGPYAVAAKGVNRADMTLQLCSQICELGNFKYFGAQYSSECFCGNSYGSQGGAPVSDCNMNCAGNAGQICGSGGRNSVYRQVYLRPIGNEFIEAPRIYMNATFSCGPFYRTLQPARSPIDCLLSCDASCQAGLFHLGTCYLLKLPALPQELVGVHGGEFFVRG